MNVHKFSSLARPLDKHNSSNRLIAILILISIPAGFFYKIISISVVGSLIWSFSLALTIFITWALARELDPDHEQAAFWPVFLVILGHVRFNIPDFFQLFLLLVLFRITNRVVGPSPKWPDSLIVLLLAGYLAFNQNWILGLISAFILFIDSRLTDGIKRHLFLSILLLLVVLAAIYFNNVVVFQQQYSLPLSLIAIVGTLLYTAFISGYGNPSSKQDITENQLDQVRLKVAQAAALITVLSYFILKGNSGFKDLYPLWSVVLALPIAFYFNRLVPGKQKPQKN